MNENENNKLSKPASQSEVKGISTTSSGGIKIGGRSRLQQAIAEAKAASPNAPLNPGDAFKAAANAVAEASNQADKLNDPLTATHRIAIMADVSGSMGERNSDERGISSKNKISHLKDALNSFLSQVNFDSTSVAIYTFPLHMGYSWEHPSEDEVDETGGFTPRASGIKFKLSHNEPMLKLAVDGLQASGGTPMHETMEKVINELPLTRGIIISDGEADSHDLTIMQAKHFAASETIVDCVHIGSSISGEALLQEIASLTGGLYLKFDNVTNFAKSFSYLTPEQRAKLALAAGPSATLAERSEVAKLLGAKEIK